MRPVDHVTGDEANVANLGFDHVAELLRSKASRYAVMNVQRECMCAEREWANDWNFNLTVHQCWRSVNTRIGWRCREVASGDECVRRLTTEYRNDKLVRSVRVQRELVDVTEGQRFRLERHCVSLRRLSADGVCNLDCDAVSRVEIRRRIVSGRCAGDQTKQ